MTNLHCATLKHDFLFIFRLSDEDDISSDEDISSQSSYCSSSSISEDSDATDTDDPLEQMSSEKQADSDWSCSYDQTIYSNGIAVQKLPHSEVTVLQWIAMNFFLFTSHPATSKSAFSDSLKVQNILNSSQKGDELPRSYKEARAMIEPYVVQKKTFKFCINNCVAFRNEYADLKECPVCHSVEQKRFIYLPIGPRLARIYGEESLAKLLQAHDGSKHTRWLMWDIQDSPVWKELYSKEGYFMANNSGVSFALEMDGVNPFHNVGIQYSMTPIMLTLLNLPRNIRNEFSNIFLVGIIPGNGCSEVTKIDPYLEILVDELLYLTKCKVVDAYQKAPVDIKIKVLLYVLDYPGLCKMFNQQGSGGLSGCHWCHVRGTYCSHLSKTIYLSNSSYVKNNCSTSMAKSPPEVLGNVTDESDSQPKLRNPGSEIYFREAYQNVKTKVDASIIASATGCKGNYALQKLPDHNRIEETLPDACHTVKDVVQNVMYLITNRNVNLQKVIKSEQASGRLNPAKIATESADRKFSSTRKTVKSKKTDQKSGSDKADSSIEKQNNIALPYILTDREIKVADERANAIKVPIGFGVKPGPFISKPGSLKSHDWKQLATQGILKYCLRDMLSEQCRKTLFSLLDILAELCAECHSSDALDHMECQLNIALASLEKDFPLTLQNITTHILHHIIPGIRRYGPVYGTWMYVFERFNSWICKRALNMRYPEATVMETFVIYDWCQFMAASGRMPQGFKAFNPEDDQISDETTDHVRSIPDEKTLPQKELRSVHKICTQCTEIKCKVRKKYCHQLTHPDSGRQIKYSCMSRSAAKTISSYIFFETKRGTSAGRISSGTYIVFGKILYFLEHIDEEHQTVISCIQTYSQPRFDNDCGLWYCSTASLKEQKSYIKDSELSHPLVTALEKDDKRIWFLNSGRRPKTGSH